MNFCAQCGAGRRAENKFCINCGAAFAQGSPRPSPLLPGVPGTIPSSPAPISNWSDMQTLWTNAGSSNVESGEGSMRSLVEEAMSHASERRQAARLIIIDSVDVNAMEACARLARQSADAEDEEFWWLEIATVPHGDQHIERGILGLCDYVLLPQHRFEEAELYVRHLIARLTSDSAGIVQPLLRRITDARQRSGKTTLSATQREHYGRFYDFLESRSTEDHLVSLVNATRDEFMPFITGYLIGVTEKVESKGLERETVAKVLRTWLTNKDCPWLSR